MMVGSDNLKSIKEIFVCAIVFGIFSFFSGRLNNIITNTYLYYLAVFVILVVLAFTVHFAFSVFVYNRDK